jgi:hypothetical protein
MAHQEEWEKDALVCCLVEKVSYEANNYLERERRKQSAQQELPLIFHKSEHEALSFKQVEGLHEGLQLKLPGERVHVDFLIPHSQVNITVYAAGFQHATAVPMVTHWFCHALYDLNHLQRLVAISSDGLVQLGDRVNAPDIVVYSPYPRNATKPGIPGRTITFVGEVERDNRNLLELIDHLGRIIDVGSVNGVLGVKHFSAFARTVLFVLRKRRDLAHFPLEVLHAFDFGPQPMATADLTAADAHMQQSFGVVPAHWTRAPNGMLDGQEVAVEIPFEVVVSGVLNATGAAPLDLVRELTTRQAAGLVGEGGWEPLRINLVDLLFCLS